MDLGAAGVMIAPPAGLKGDDAIVTYFQNCAEAIGSAPFALQDFPQVNGVFIPVSVIERVAATCPTCVMLKHEDWPGLDKLTARRARVARNGRRDRLHAGAAGAGDRTPEGARGVVRVSPTGLSSSPRSLPPSPELRQSRCGHAENSGVCQWVRTAVNDRHVTRA